VTCPEITGNDSLDSLPTDLGSVDGTVCGGKVLGDIGASLFKHPPRVSAERESDLHTGGVFRVPPDMIRIGWQPPTPFRLVVGPDPGQLMELTPDLALLGTVVSLS